MKHYEDKELGIDYDQWIDESDREHIVGTVDAGRSINLISEPGYIFKRTNDGYIQTPKEIVVRTKNIQLWFSREEIASIKRLVQAQLSWGLPDKYLEEAEIKLEKALKKAGKMSKRKIFNNLIIRSATVYRTEAKSLKSESERDNYGDSNEPQFQFSVFCDGTVAQRWLIGDSFTWWPNLAELYSVHIYAHPDYGTRVEWDDGTVEEL